MYNYVLVLAVEHVKQGGNLTLNVTLVRGRFGLVEAPKTRTARRRYVYIMERKIF